MEENKVKTGAEEAPQKLSYEQLENVARQAIAQIDEYKKVLTQLAGTQKRMDYLFKILEVSHLFDDEFVTKCADEIQKIMTIPERPEKAEEETTNEEPVEE